MGNLILAFVFNILFFCLYMKANSACKKATAEFLEIWSFLRLLVLLFQVYFFGELLWIAAGCLA